MAELDERVDEIEDEMPASSYGTRPTQLKTNPVMKQKVQNQKSLDDIFGNAQAAPAPKPQAVPQEAQPIQSRKSLDEIFGGQPTAVPQPEGSITPDIVAEMAREKLAGMEHQGAKAEASFAQNPRELKGFLERRFGKENVRPIGKGDEFEIKQGKSWKPFLAGNLTDFQYYTARPVVEAAIALPIEAAGILAGGIATAASGGAAAPIGKALAVGGLATGGVAGLKGGDLVAEHVYGIEQDPERNKALEAGLAGTLNVAIPLLGSAVFRKLSARKAAQEAAIKEGTQVTEAKLLSRESEEFIKSADELQDSGLIQNIPGTNTPYLLYQAHPNNPETKAIAETISGSGKFQKAVKDQGDAYYDSVQKLMREAANAGDKGLLRDEALPTVITSIADEMKKAEGREIAKYKTKAMISLKGKPQPVSPEVRATIRELVEKLGFTGEVSGGKLVAPSIDEVVGKMGLQTEAAGRDFIKIVGDAYRRTQEGAMTPAAFDEAVTALSGRIKGAQKSGGEISAVYQRLVSQMRQNRKAAIEAGLSDGDKAAFNHSMTRYGDILDAQDGLVRSLDNELSADIFAKRIFNQGGDSLRAVKSAKVLLEKDHPEVWNRLKGHFLSTLLEGAENAKSRTHLDSEKLLGRIKGYGPVIDEVMGAEGAGNLKKLLTFGRRLEATEFAALPKNVQQELISQGTGLLSAFNGAKARSAYLIIKQLFRGNEPEVFATMTNEGIEKFLSQVPKNDRASVKGMIKSAMDYANLGAMKITPVPMTVRGATAESITRSFVPDFAQSAQGIMAPQQEAPRQ